MSLDNLPRLSDEDRTALDDGYVAIEGALTGVPPTDSPTLHAGTTECRSTPRALGRKRTEFEERAAAVLAPPRRP